MLSILVHKEMKRHLSGLIHLALFLAIPNPSGSFLHPQMRSHDRIQTILSSELIGSKMKSGTTPNEQNNKILPCLMLIGTILTGTIDKTSIHDAAFAYGSDYVGETVVNAVKNLKEARGDELASFKALENIGDIITEGKGIGGSISYTGVKLERGYVANEDTTIYNPGLTLLTESEKSDLVEAVIGNKKANVETNTWSEKNQLAYNFLKQKLDPWHIVELKGFLAYAPVYGAILYLVSLFVQQNKRDFFPVTYLISAAAFFIPIFVLLATGP